MELLSILWMLVVIFTLAKIAGLIFKKIGIPGLVGEIIIGIVFANLVIGDGKTIAEMFDITKVIVGTEVVTSVNFDILDVLAQIGVMFLLFGVGLETRVKELLSVGKTAFLVAFFGVVVPFLLGFLYVEFIFDPGNMASSLFLGTAMVATSVGITARVIKDLKLTNSKESKIIIGAAVIDDVLGMVVLAIVKGIVGSETGQESFLEKIGINGTGEIICITIIAIVFVVLWLFIAAKIVPKIYEWVKQREAAKDAAKPNRKRVEIEIFALAIIVCLGSAALSEFIGLAAIIGSFLAGVLFAEHAEEWNLTEKVEAINSLLVPFFFVIVGLQVNLSLIKGDIFLAIIAVIILAIIGKYIGCSLGAKFGDKNIDKKSMNIIGVGMIPRGEVGIIVATIGLNVIGTNFTNLYSIVVIMSVITTMIAPPILAYLFKKKYPDGI